MEQTQLSAPVEVQVGRKFSASSLNELTKCGYKYFLTRVKGDEEPGKRAYNMLQGDIVGTAIQSLCLLLNRKKEVTDFDMSQALYDAYAHHYTEAGITPDLLVPIKEILLEGLNESAMMALDDLSFAINSSPRYEIKIPARLKNGGLSTNKKKPPLPYKVVKTLEDIQWFFSSRHAYINMIRSAERVEVEEYFEIPCGTPYTNSYVGANPETGLPFEINETLQDYVVGYFDIRLHFHNGSSHIFELKYVSTPYTQELVNILNQAVTYSFVDPHATVTVFDIQHQKYYSCLATPQIKSLVWKRYDDMQKMVSNNIFVPACGTDPFNTSKMLCGFKSCGGCEFSCREETEEDEAA